MIGSRDGDAGARERRRARRERAGRGQRGGGAGVDLAVLAVAAEAALETARELAGALGSTPLLSVASALAFARRRSGPTPTRLSLAERVQLSSCRARSSRGCTRSPPRNLERAPPREDALVCGDDPAAKELALDARRRSS